MTFIAPKVCNTGSDMSQDNTQPQSAAGKELFPVLPLRDIVVFPYMIVPLFVGREKSIAALEEVMQADKQILLAAQRNAGDDDPSPRGECLLVNGHHVGPSQLAAPVYEAATTRHESFDCS